MEVRLVDIARQPFEGVWPIFCQVQWPFSLVSFFRTFSSKTGINEKLVGMGCTWHSKLVGGDCFVELKC